MRDLVIQTWIPPLEVYLDRVVSVTILIPPLEIQSALVWIHNHDTRYYTKEIIDQKFEEFTPDLTPIQNQLDDHIEDTNNPHWVTKTQVGLWNVDNTSDINKPISNAVQTALNDLSSSITALIGWAPTDANTLKKLNDKILNILTLLGSDNVNLDNVQELVDAIETIQTSLATILVNDLTTGGVTKALTAEQGKVLKWLIDAIPTGAWSVWASWEVQISDGVGWFVSSPHIKANLAPDKQRLALQAWSNPQATLQAGAKVGTTVSAPTSGSNTQIAESVNNPPTVTPVLHVEPRATSNVNFTQQNDEGGAYYANNTNHAYQIYRGKTINWTLYRSQFYADVNWTDDGTNQNYNVGLEFSTTDTNSETIDGDTWIIYKNWYFIDSTTSNTWTDNNQNNNLSPSAWGTYTHVSSGGGSLDAPSSMEWPTSDGMFTWYTEDGRYVRYEMDSFDSTYDARSGSPVSGSIALGSSYSSLGIQIDANSGGTQSGFVVRRQFSFDYWSTWQNASWTPDAWDYCYLYDLYYDSSSSYNFIDENFSHNSSAETTWNNIFSGGGGTTETDYAFRARGIINSPATWTSIYSETYTDYTVTISDIRNYIIEHQYSGNAKLFADVNLGISYGVISNNGYVDTYYTSWWYGTSDSPQHYWFSGVNQNIEYKVWSLQTISGVTIESLTPLTITQALTSGYKYNSLAWSAVSGVTTYKIQRRVNGGTWYQTTHSGTSFIDDATRSWWSTSSYATEITVGAARFERNMASLTDNPIVEFVTLATSGDRHTVVGFWSATDENTPASLQAFIGHQVSTWYMKAWSPRLDIASSRWASTNTMLWGNGSDFNMDRKSSSHFNVRWVNDNLINTRSDMDAVKIGQAITMDNACALEAQAWRSSDVAFVLSGHSGHSLTSINLRFQDSAGSYKWWITVGAHILATSGNASNPGHAIYNDVDTGVGSNGANTLFCATGAVIAIYITSAQKVAIGNQNQSPQARLDVTETTLGQAVQKNSSVATNDDPCVLTFQNRLATTNNTQSTLHTFAIPTNKTVSLDCWVIARRTGGSAGANGDSASYRVVGTFKNISGVVTLVGALTNLFTHEDQAWWDCTLSISGANVLLRVTGATNNNITWHLCEWNYTELGS